MSSSGVGSSLPIKWVLSLGLCFTIYIWIQISYSLLWLYNNEDYISLLPYHYTQKSYFELICPISYAWFSLALWIAKPMLWGKVLVGAHLCFHRNSNSFQCTCLWYLKRKGERLFQFAWQNSLMWAICYINAWTPTPGIVSDCPGLVAFLPEDHLPSFLWQRGENISSALSQIIALIPLVAICFFKSFPILGDCKKQTEGQVLFLRANTWQFSGRCMAVSDPYTFPLLQPHLGLYKLVHDGLWEFGFQ